MIRCGKSVECDVIAHVFDGRSLNFVYRILLPVYRCRILLRSVLVCHATAVHVLKAVIALKMDRLHFSYSATDDHVSDLSALLLCVSTRSSLVLVCKFVPAASTWSKTWDLILLDVPRLLEQRTRVAHVVHAWDIPRGVCTCHADASVVAQAHRLHHSFASIRTKGHRN